MSVTSIYPAGPAGVNPALTEPAPSFKKQVTRVIGAIVLFCFVYLLLLLLAVGLGFLAITAGIFVITNYLSFLTLVLGLGLVGLGVMVIVFLIKFLFAAGAKGDPNRIQIFEEDHPQLFAFIRQLTIDTNTPMPKKVFLVPDVNAAVFYDSNFRSLFLPDKKNLEIGLGLVNVLNLSEFKMVLAHEFGHFSQRSMKLGSYVFTVNKAIYNMLYQNQGYDKALGTWAEIHGIFALMAHLTVWIARGIQAVLRKMYGIINLQYMSLSREMEFHADAVAVSVTGSDIASSAMRRIEFISTGMHYALRKSAELADEQSAMRNMFDTQRKVNLFSAGVNKIDIVGGLPKISDECLAKFSSSRLHYKDQWATHPALDEREERFSLAAVSNTTDSRSPWILFSNPTALEEQMTRHYVKVNYPDAEVKETVESETLLGKLESYYQLYQFPLAFNGYYDNRSFTAINEHQRANKSASFETLYGTDTTHRIKKYFQDQQDLSTLQSIQKKEIAVKHFQFDQQRYTLKQIQPVIDNLEKEIAADAQWLQETDQAAWHYHQTLALATGQQYAESLKTQYTEILTLQKELEDAETVINKILQRINYIYGQQFTLEGLLSELEALKTEEAPFRNLLNTLIRTGIVEPAIDETFLDDARKYRINDPVYFKNDEVQGTALIELYNLCNRTIYCFTKAIELKKKYYLEKVHELHLQSSSIPA